MEPMQQTALAPLTRDLLMWIAAEPRTYAETMDAWKTHCPRLSIWEDALIEGLIEVRHGVVRLTDSGVSALG